MKFYTGFEYLLLDAANNIHKSYNLKHCTFDEKIDWIKSNISTLEDLVFNLDHWKEKPLYLKAVWAIREAQAGKPIGHMVGLDAVCSGLQLMACVSNCEASARLTGLINTGERPDAYSAVAKHMAMLLGQDLPVDIGYVKQAVMTCLYGSKQVPEEVFGKDTKELEVFYASLQELMPGPMDLLNDLVSSWNPTALSHDWTMPDGFKVKTPVIQSVQTTFQIPELENIEITVTTKENVEMDKGVKNAANVIHSIDGYVMRSLIRRCSYNEEEVNRVLDLIDNQVDTILVDVPELIEHYLRTKMVDTHFLYEINSNNVSKLPSDYLIKLKTILLSMKEHKPFPVIGIHDDFHAHPNNLNWVRVHYRNILVELSKSTIMEGIIHELTGGFYYGYEKSLHTSIEKSEYLIC